MDPHLDESEIARHWREGSLPARFRTVPAGATLVPLVRPGVAVVVERVPAVRGDLVCTVAQGRVHWRRVLELRDGSARVRGEHVPFEDGWTSDLVGRVLVEHRLNRLARRFPGLWCAAQWEALLARSRLASTWRRRPRRPRVALTVRRLGPDDRERFRSFYAKAWGATRDIDLTPPTLYWGLFTDTGRLVGSTALDLRDDGTAGSKNTVVVEELRGCGGGRLLFEAKVADARALGVTRIVSLVRATNTASLRMVRSVGFRPTGRWGGREDDPATAADRALVELVWTASLSPRRTRTTPPRTR